MLHRLIFFIICILHPILGFGKEYEVYVDSGHSTLPLNVSLDVSQDKITYAQSLYQILIQDIALGDVIIPSTQSSTNNLLRLVLSIKYPHAQIIFYNNHLKQTIKSFALTGSLNLDRATIHQVADQVHLLLTGTPGISSGKILFSISSDNQASTPSLKQGELWSIDYDGCNLQKITSEESLSITPKLFSFKNTSPYLYVSYKNGIPKIFLNFLNKHEESRKIINLKGNQFMPDISLTKNQLVFVSDILGNPDLFIQKFSMATGALGSPEKLLKEPFGTQGNPVFSPDGNKLVFISNKDGSPRLYLLNLNESHQRPKLLTKKYRSIYCPSWSPDGKKISFCTTIKGVKQICYHDLTKSEDYQLTFCSNNKEDPTWGPDSKHIIFSSVTNNSSQLFLLSLITKKTKQITIGPGEKRFPTWGNFSNST